MKRLISASVNQCSGMQWLSLPAQAGESPWFMRSYVYKILTECALKPLVALRQARANGAYCVGLADTHVSPIARYADESFIVSIDAPVYGAAYAAPMAFLNALLAARANYWCDRTLAILKEIEHEQRHGSRWYED